VFVSFQYSKEERMEQRISLITLGVKDLNASRRFYVDGLGWQPVHEDNEIVFFQTGGMVLALFRRDKLAEDFGVDPASFGRAPSVPK
jgi:catechol 2,3-dioxygenase-like lactoylglutathione lyase family enzyme